MLLVKPITGLINQVLQRRLMLEQQVRLTHQLKLQLLLEQQLLLDFTLRLLLQLGLKPQSGLAQLLIIMMLERLFILGQQELRQQLLVGLQLLGLELKLELQLELVPKPFLLVIVERLHHHLLLEPKPKRQLPLLEELYLLCYASKLINLITHPIIMLEVNSNLLRFINPN